MSAVFCFSRIPSFLGKVFLHNATPATLPSIIGRIETKKKKNPQKGSFFQRYQELLYFLKKSKKKSLHSDASCERPSNIGSIWGNWVAIVVLSQKYVSSNLGIICGNMQKSRSFLRRFSGHVDEFSLEHSENTSKDPFVQKSGTGLRELADIQVSFEKRVSSPWYLLSRTPRVCPQRVSCEQEKRNL